MLNQVVVVGRLAHEIKKEKAENGGSKCILTIAIPRSFKNADGKYDTDFIECITYGSVADNTKTYCNKGDVIGIKGRIQNDQIVNDDGEITGKTNLIIAEKITFLSSNKEEK